VNTSVCFGKRNFYDGNGNYIQSACFVNQEKTWTQAEAYCQANGMDLINISSKDVLDELFFFAREVFGTATPFAVLFVNGRFNDQCLIIRSDSAGYFELDLSFCFESVFFFCGFEDKNQI
jgi:hypothetical protein